MIKLFLTGGSGFLGSRFIELYGKKIKIKALMRKDNINFPNIEAVKGDLLDLDSLIQATRDCNAIIHSGGSTPNRAYAEGHYNATIKGTYNLIEAAKINKIRRFIFISSMCAHFPRKRAYAKSKLIAEEYVKNSGLDWTILCPETIVGSKGKDLHRMLKLWSKSRLIPIIGNGNYLNQPIYVNDACSAMYQSLYKKKSINQIINVTGRDTVTFNEFVSEFAQKLGNRKFKLVHLPKVLAYPMAELISFLNPKWGLNKERIYIITHSRIIDISKLKKILEIRPMRWENMVKLTVKEFQSV